jgi:hypothetical protein
MSLQKKLIFPDNLGNSSLPFFAIDFSFYRLKILVAVLCFSRQMGFHYISITGTKHLQQYLITLQASLKFPKNLILPSEVFQRVTCELLVRSDSIADKNILDNN